MAAISTVNIRMSRLTANRGPRRLFSSVAALAALALVTACGGSESGAPTQPTVQAVATQAVAAGSNIAATAQAAASPVVATAQAAGPPAAATVQAGAGAVAATSVTLAGTAVAAVASPSPSPT